MLVWKINLLQWLKFSSVSFSRKTDRSLCADATVACRKLFDHLLTLPCPWVSQLVVMTTEADLRWTRGGKVDKLAWKRRKWWGNAVKWGQLRNQGRSPIPTLPSGSLLKKYVSYWIASPALFSFSSHSCKHFLPFRNLPLILFPISNLPRSKLSFQFFHIPPTQPILFRLSKQD